MVPLLIHRRVVHALTVRFLYLLMLHVPTVGLDSTLDLSLTASLRNKALGSLVLDLTGYVVIEVALTLSQQVALLASVVPIVTAHSASSIILHRSLWGKSLGIGMVIVTAA